MKISHLGCLVLILSTGLAVEPSQVEFFEKKIRPLLVENCYSCHSEAEKIKGGLRLDTRAATLVGGDTGPAIEPGDPDASLLVEVVTWENEDLQMPPKKKLSENQVRDLKKWIEMGAPDPRSEGPKPESFSRSEIDYEKGREHWIYQPIRTPASGRSLDGVIDEKLAREGLEPVALSPPEKLVRRFYYDLIGLPPSPEQARAFLSEVEKQGRGAAINGLVDSLLDSSHFGERWGRHWLDVVRFAESNGMERNFLYPKAWKYRDYVIDSFNKDKPFNEFAREQIAGDFLGSDEAKIATGFLAIGPKMLNERDREVFGYEVIDEQIDATTRAFLGLTVSCARCHDHKFDAISQGDYYALAGIFRSTTTHFGTKNGGGNRQGSTMMAVGENAEERMAALKEFNQKLAALNQAAKKKEREVGQARKKVQTLKKQKKMTAADQMASEMKEAADEMKQMKSRINKLRNQRPPEPEYAMGVSDRDKPVDSPLLIRGNPKTKSDVVSRGIPAVFKTVTGLPAIPADQSGRLELAHWIANDENPLTARVIANRVWSHLFGAGIVATVDNFGESGQAPSHPELIDFLAARLIQHDWSVKGLIREIVSSDAYQRSSEMHEGNYEIDPDNRFHWRQSLRRLDAEAIRDSILSFSGELNPSPRAGSVVDEMGGGNFGRDGKLNAKLAEGIKTNHRSIYMPVVRNATPMAMKIFDAAESSLIVGKRNETNVPSQALYLMNSHFVIQRSEKIAERIRENAEPSDSWDGRITDAFRLVLGRSPSTAEVDRALELLSSHPEPESGFITFCQALISSAEFRYLN